MKKTLTKILLTIFGGGIALAAPIVPAEVAVHGQFDTKEKVETHRKYLKERADYYEQIGLSQEHKNEAAHAKDAWEQKLLDDGFVDVKGGQVKEKPTKRQSVLETVVSMDWVQRAYAYTFGKNDWETCGTAVCNFDSLGGSGMEALDNTSKVTGTYSGRCDIAGAGSCIWRKSVTSANEYWMQMKIFIPSGWTFGASAYAGLLYLSDTTSGPVYCNIENYGSVRITCAGPELPYTDTGINLSLNTVHTIEIRVKTSTTVGDVDIWVDNTTEGSPDYNGSGTLNTGADSITEFYPGGFYPDAVNDIFFDDVILNTGFIGAGIEAPVFKSTLRGGLNVKGGGTIK